MKNIFCEKYFRQIKPLKQGINQNSRFSSIGQLLFHTGRVLASWSCDHGFESCWVLDFLRLLLFLFLLFKIRRRSLTRFLKEVHLSLWWRSYLQIYTQLSFLGQSMLNRFRMRLKMFSWIFFNGCYWQFQFFKMGDFQGY